jgi:hypothetical protein
MSNQVYANGREIACKAAAGKTVAAFPDVCLSPPSPPAGPVPIPYPNTAKARDTTNGSTTVQISGQEVMLKDQSTFKTSTGDEAATKSLGMGVITHTIQGEASFISWSSDVKIEGCNVDRHLDMTIHNEQCNPADTPPMAYADEMFLAAIEAWSEAAPLCECCGRLAHSVSQANGDEVTEDEFYAGDPDGATWVGLAREYCPHLVPPAPPTNDPCAKYYRGIPSTKGPRADFSQAGANPLSNPNSLPWVHGKGKMAHRVPLAAGGCPVGEKNLSPVGNDPNCKYLEDISGNIHKNCMDALK